MTDQPTSETSTTEDFLIDTAWALKEAADRLAAIVTDDPRQQWNAYCEFAYAFVFLCDQYLGQALAAKGLAKGAIQADIKLVDNVVLTILLARRAGVEPASEVAEKMYADHHRVLEQRAEQWAGMPLFEPEGSRGPVGSFTWEVPKQAIRSTSGNEHDFLKVTETSTRFSTSAMAIPQAMKYLADAWEPC